jgi:hypothetical protein
MSAYWQAPVGASGYVLLNLALNVASSRGAGSRGSYPILENPQTWLPGAQVRAEMGHKNELQQAVRRQNSAHPRQSRWEKGPVQIGTMSCSFKVGGPSPSARSDGTVSGMGCMAPQPFASGGSWVVSRLFLGRNWRPVVPGV